MSTQFTPAQSWDLQGRAAEALENEQFNHQAAAQKLTEFSFHIAGQWTLRVVEYDPLTAEDLFLWALDMFLDNMLDRDGEQAFLAVLQAGLSEG